MLDKIQQISSTMRVSIIYAAIKITKEVFLPFDIIPLRRMTMIRDEVRKQRSTEQVGERSSTEKDSSRDNFYQNIPEFQKVFLKTAADLHEMSQRRFIDGLSKELQIVEIRNEHTCNKHRVDAMDFKLWHVYSMKLEISARKYQIPISRVNETQ